MARSKLQERLAKKAAKEEALNARIIASAKYPRQKKTRRKKQLSGYQIAERLKIKPEWLILNPGHYEPRSCNLERQTREFIKKCVCKYHVPPFMYSVWYSEQDEDFRPWFITMAQGGSLYKLHTKGILSKSETADFVKNSSSELSVKQNIWVAKLKGMGASVSYAKDLVCSRFIFIVNHSKFWTETARFFVVHSVDKRDRDELLDFLRNKHVEDTNFSIQGRTLQSLIKLSNEWHEEQTHKMALHGDIWPGMPVEDWTYTNQYTVPGMGNKVKRIWTIEQIKTSKQLFFEGRKMHHCVGSYVHDCKTERSAIFKMESFDDYEGHQKHVTIEVHPASRRIVQARGKMNTNPSPAARAVMERWRKLNL